MLPALAVQCITRAFAPASSFPGREKGLTVNKLLCISMHETIAFYAPQIALTCFIVFSPVVLLCWYCCQSHFARLDVQAAGLAAAVILTRRLGMNIVRKLLCLLAVIAFVSATAFACAALSQAHSSAALSLMAPVCLALAAGRSAKSIGAAFAKRHTTATGFG